MPEYFFIINVSYFNHQRKGGISLYIRRTISVFAAALSIGVCAYITYISREADRSSILFNLTFLAVMLLMLTAAIAFGMRRLMQVCKGLRHGINTVQHASEDGVSLSGGYPIFQNRFLDECYQQYCRMTKRNPDASCDIRNFINEESIETYVHRGILELIPDILTSLGILGTFVGLVMGLREFDPSGYEQMAGSVTPLINGIKVAFITSIYGISLSLSYSFDLRSEFSNLSALVEEFLDVYYLNVKPPYEVDSLTKLLRHQKDQEEMTHELTSLFIEQMTQSFEQAITPAFARMTDGINRVVDTFTQSQAQVMSQVCETVIRQMRSELASDFAKITNTVAELEKAQSSYTDFMDCSMVRMQQTFVSLQDNLSEMGQYNTQALDSLTAAQREAMRINQEQKNTYQEYIRFMYQSIEKFSEVWEKNSETLQNYSNEIASMGPVQSSREIKNELNAISELLKDVQKRQISSELAADLTSGDQTEEMLSRTLRKLDDLEELVSGPRLFGGRRKKK